MRSAVWALFLLPFLFVLGCAEITPPTVQEVIESPFGKGPLRLGMSKEEVRAIWGEPDSVEEMGQDQWGTVKQTWVYEAKYAGVVPFDVGHASKTKYLIFSGDYLTAFHD